MATHSSFLPGESQGRGSLVGCRLWGRTESDMTDATWQQQQRVFVFLFLTSSLCIHLHIIFLNHLRITGDMTALSAEYMLSLFSRVRLCATP